ncbi:MAG: hypothetical protein KY429_00840 [Actinobacteria bacterium]|nr:hypothetical protein [Actinomycetota bacterium]
MNTPLASWCGPIPVQDEEELAVSKRWLTSEGPGYLAMVAFLAAYLLMVAQAHYLVPALLNLVGSAGAVIYLRRKAALPSLISNLIWMAVTIIGLMIRLL